MRCPDCNKFVPYDTDVDPEESGDVEFDGDTFTSTFTRTLTCGECGTELKSAEIEVVSESATVEEPEKDKDAELCECGERQDAHADIDPETDHTFTGTGEYDGHEHEWEATVDDASPDMRVIDVDRRGRKIKNPRYMTTEYGVIANFSAECDCGAKASASGEGYMAASSFDEMV